MATLADDLLLEVLKACAQSAPAPLYPSDFAQASGLERPLLDEALDHLRMRLVQFTDWVRGNGQGYALTPEGALVLKNPRLLKRAQISVPAPALSVSPDRSDSPWTRGEAVRDVLLNPVRPVVCMTLLALNILMFAIGLFMAMQQGAAVSDYLGNTGNRQVALIRDEMGALIPAEVIVKNQWWRLLAYAFVHGGLFHLGMNMYFLFSLGPLIETLWGSFRFLVLYLVGALAGGCAVMLTMRSTVGASGALCGLLTSMGVWVYLNRGFLPPHLVSNWMRNVFTNIILIAIISTLPLISWECHLGGAIGGALVSVPLNYQRFGRGWQKLVGLVGVAAVPLVSVGLVVAELDALREPLKAQLEVYEVHRDLYPPYREAEAKAATVYNDHAVPLLKNWNNAPDKARLAAAKHAFQGAQQQLQQTLAVFDSAGPFQEKKVADTVRKGRAYLEEWSRLYALFDKTLANPPPWPAEQRQALDLQMARVSRAQKPLANSSLLPAVYAEKDAPEP